MEKEEIEKFLRSEEGQRVVEILKAFDRNHRWIAKNYEQLKREYPNMYIAVKDEKVIMAEEDKDVLIEKLSKEYGYRRDEPSDIAITLIRVKPVSFLFCG